MTAAFQQRSIKQTAIQLVAITLASGLAFGGAKNLVSQSNSLAVELAHASKQPVPEKLRPHVTPIDYTGNSNSQCELMATGSPLDLAISGDGFLIVKLARETGGGIGYTRDGALERNCDGDLVIASSGLKLIPPITLPMGATDIEITQDGIVHYTPAGQARQVSAGIIRLARFANRKRLQKVGPGLYCRTDFSGEPIVASPGSNDLGQLAQGYLEALPEMQTAALPGPPSIQGALIASTNPLDIAICGEGFLKIRLEPTIGDGTGYTRVGKLELNENGRLVVGTAPEYPLIPAIALPPGATHITIAQDGTVQYRPKDATTVRVAGQILLTQFINPRRLLEVAKDIYVESADSGAAVVDTAGNNGSGVIFQGYTCHDEYAIPHSVSHKPVAIVNGVQARAN